MKRWIVINLERACVITHHWPVKHIPGINYCWMANLSDTLDQRWGTGVWSWGDRKRFPIEKGLATTKEPFWWPMQAPPRCPTTRPTKRTATPQVTLSPTGRLTDPQPEPERA